MKPYLGWLYKGRCEVSLFDVGWFFIWVIMFVMLYVAIVMLYDKVKRFKK